MEILHNALYQWAAINHADIGKGIGNGGSHSHFMNNCVLTALAAGLKERIPLLLPEELGLCENGNGSFPPHIVMTNLTMALWYKREDWEAISRNEAEKRLDTKIPLIFSTAIHYLLALLDGDTKAAGTWLEQHCGAVPGIRDKFHATKLENMFWYEAHGFYNLAFFALGKDKALEIPMPKHDCFCNALADWQIERNFAPGKLFLEYPAPMELLNTILTCTPPAIKPIEAENTGRKNIYVTDVQSFKNGLIAAVLAGKTQ